MQDSIKEILQNLQSSGESALILCKNSRHKNVIRTSLSRERVKLLQSPETKPFARKITSQILTIGQRTYLKIYLKESLKVFGFNEAGELTPLKNLPRKVKS